MKIVIVNYRYFISGGPERYMFNIMDILQQNGHEVIPFSVKHDLNTWSEYSEYFCDPIGTGAEIYGHEYKRDLKTVCQVTMRMIYSFEAKRKFKKLLSVVKPDLVYVLQFQNKLSCSVIDVAYEMGIPIVQRISDFGHICIDNIFYHYQTQTVCERCLTGSKWNAIRWKCANNSYINSLIKAIALKVQDLRKIKRKIDAFIIPASFTVTKFVEFGVPKKNIYNIPTFFNLAKELPANVSYEDFFLYVGRVDPDKGLMTLVNAFINTPYRLVIVGFSMDGYDEVIKEYLKDKKHNITFTGKLDFKQMIPYLQSCLCTICPSEWYDNFPNSVLESYAFEKPVLASRIGSLRDLIVNNETGLHFEAGDSRDILEKVEYIYNNPTEAQRMGKNSYTKLIKEYSSQLHYNRLIDVFHETVKRKASKATT